MKVAITGGNGFLARYCTDLFYEHGIEAILLARKVGKYREIQFTVTDYSAESLNKIFAEERIDSIVHLAGPRKAYHMISEYKDYFDMTTAIYDVAVNRGITNVVFASSISVYSGEELPYKEDFLLMPGNNYGLSKIVCEQIGNIYSRNKGLCIKNLRFAHLYGANEDNMYMVNKFFNQAYNHEQIFVDCKSFSRREMMYTKDAAFAVMCALKNSELSGTYNIGSGDNLTNEDIANYICHCMSPEMKVLVRDGKENIKPSYMDSSRALSELGFKAKYNMETAVSEIYEAMREKYMG